jgi:hypothetical protein
MARICHRWLYFFCGFPGHGSLEHEAPLPGNGGHIPFPLALPLGNGNGIPPSFEPGHRPAVLKIFFAPMHVGFHRLNALRQRAFMGNDENGIYGRRDRRNLHLVFFMRKEWNNEQKTIKTASLAFLLPETFAYAFFLLPLNYPNNTKIEP